MTYESGNLLRHFCLGVFQFSWESTMPTKNRRDREKIHKKIIIYVIAPAPVTNHAKIDVPPLPEKRKGSVTRPVFQVLAISLSKWVNRSSSRVVTHQSLLLLDASVNIVVKMGLKSSILLREEDIADIQRETGCEWTVSASIRNRCFNSLTDFFVSVSLRQPDNKVVQQIF